MNGSCTCFAFKTPSIDLKIMFFLNNNVFGIYFVAYTNGVAYTWNFWDCLSKSIIFTFHDIILNHFQERQKQIALIQQLLSLPFRAPTHCPHTPADNDGNASFWYVLYHDTYIYIYIYTYAKQQSNVYCAIQALRLHTRNND